MKLITAVIKPHKVDEVKDALRAVGVKGITIAEVKGFGRQGGHTETYRGAEYTIEFTPKIKLEVVVDADIADSVVETIQVTANSGQIGDGKIWVSPVEGLVRIRTGEQGKDAL
ncbi:MAG: P-II family nitrogen regulator [Acidimicrobiia bacterium]|nr:P-II family nitrogen regulator [Acidimicrobiia bacterium]